jgi:predicted Zn-dependent protease
MRTSACITVLTVLTASAQQPQIGQGVNFYSLEKEATLGAALAQDVRQRTTPVDSSTVGAYVEKIGRQLATQLPNVRFTYTFAVIADDMGGSTHEPLSLPAGYIFVTANLIRNARNEGEFAGMLAHAMAHAAERHGTRQATRGQLANLATVPLIFMGGPAGLGAGGEQLIPIGFLHLQRQFENEADALAIQLMAGAGFDPQALVSYIGRVQQADANPSTMSKVFSSLPPRDSRIASMQKTIQGLPPHMYASSDEFYLIQDQVRR